MSYFSDNTHRKEGEYFMYFSEECILHFLKDETDKTTY